MSYNGWSNYATFRVHNDILNFIKFEDSVSIEELREIVRDVVFSNVQDDRALCIDYTNLFLNNVKWNELVEVYNTDILTQKLNINGN